MLARPSERFHVEITLTPGNSETAQRFSSQWQPVLPESIFGVSASGALYMKTGLLGSRAFLCRMQKCRLRGISLV